MLKLTVGNLAMFTFFTTCDVGFAIEVPAAEMPTTLRERTIATTATMVISRCVFIFFLLRIFNMLPRALILTRTSRSRMLTSSTSLTHSVKEVACCKSCQQMLFPLIYLAPIQVFSLQYCLLNAI
jgi:hypothetical protein